MWVVACKSQKMIYMPRFGQRRENSVAYNIRKDEERLLGSFLRTSVGGDSED